MARLIRVLRGGFFARRRKARRPAAHSRRNPAGEDSVAWVASPVRRNLSDARGLDSSEVFDIESELSELSPVELDPPASAEHPAGRQPRTRPRRQPQRRAPTAPQQHQP